MRMTDIPSVGTLSPVLLYLKMTLPGMTPFAKRSSSKGERRCDSLQYGRAAWKLKEEGVVVPHCGERHMKSAVRDASHLLRYEATAAFGRLPHRAERLKKGRSGGPRGQSLDYRRGNTEPSMRARNSDTL